MRFRPAMVGRLPGNIDPPFGVILKGSESLTAASGIGTIKLGKHGEISGVGCVVNVGRIRILLWYERKKKMIRHVLLAALAFVAMSSPTFAGGGGKNNGTLVITNAAVNGGAGVSIAVVIDPPAAWAQWVAPFTQAQKDQLAKRATIIAATGTQAFSVKKGAHKVLAVNTVSEAYTLTDVSIVKKQSTAITVTP